MLIGAWRRRVARAGTKLKLSSAVDSIEKESKVGTDWSVKNLTQVTLFFAFKTYIYNF